MSNVFGNGARMRLKCFGSLRSKNICFVFIGSKPFFCRRGRIFLWVWWAFWLLFKESYYLVAEISCIIETIQICAFVAYILKDVLKNLNFFLLLGNLVLCYLAQAWHLLITTGFKSADRLLKFKVCELVGDIALMAACWIVWTWHYLRQNET